MKLKDEIAELRKIADDDCTWKMDVLRLLDFTHKAIAALRMVREVKDPCEIDAIERALDEVLGLLEKEID